MTMTTTHLESLSSYASTNQLPIVARFALTFAATVTVWDQRMRTRRELSKLEPAQLWDIGMTVEEARVEAQKKMWQV